MVARPRDECSPLVVEGGSLVARNDGASAALVEVGAGDVLVHAQVVRATPGTGVVLSASDDGASGIVLVAGEADRTWALRLRADDAETTVATFEASQREVVVQVIRRGDEARVVLGTDRHDVVLPADAPDGDHVGVVAVGPGAEVDLFGYLRLAAG